jgi:hypothetical protein
MRNTRMLRMVESVRQGHHDMDILGHFTTDGNLDFTNVAVDLDAAEADNVNADGKYSVCI